MAGESEPAVVAELRRAMAEAVAAGASLRSLSRESGTHLMSVTRFYKGERDITLTSAAKLCAALGLTLTKKGRAKAKG